MSAPSATGSTRRSVLGGAGFLLLGFCFGGRAAFGQPPPAPALPGSLAGHSSLDAWLRIGADGTVTVLSGKVELGQGIRTALAQIVADELDVALDRLRMVSADTDLSPNEGYTSGSVSIQQSGAALRQAAAEARLVLLEIAASRLGAAVGDLAVDDGRITPRAGAPATTPGRPASSSGDPAETADGPATSYWELVTDSTLQLEATGRASPKPHSARRLVGRPVPRLDAPGKVFGEPVFVHDLRLPGMLHARAVRPPSYGARLASVDEAAALALPGVVRVVRDGSFLAVVAEREEQAVAAAEALARDSRWSGTTELPDRARLAEHLRRLPARDGTVSSRGADPGSVPAARTIEAEYTKPFLAHASLAPSCAVAQEVGDRIRVWTHSQGVFPLRAALSRVLGLAPERLRVTHVEGSGCYGHNGADDVACDAALVARAVPGRPVRVQWSRQDELRWAPFGSAMAIRVRGGLDGAGRIAFWWYELWSHAHSTRPGREAGLVAAWHLASPQPPPTAVNIPQPAGGGNRNAVPLYELPSQRVVEHFLPDMPVRVSALRSLGAYANVFAIESFMDELAAAAGADPVAFRLHHLTDPRARAVIEAAARQAGRTIAVSRSPGDAQGAPTDTPGRTTGADPGAAPTEVTSGVARGRGFAFARYKNQAAYVALVADVVVDRATGVVRLERATAAVDAGDVVNPDGLRNQIEGGIAQAASWTLHEEVAFDRERITSVDWRTYPISRFVDAPELSVAVLERPQEPPVGAGEAAQGPTAAAIANAVFAATGVRLRDLPLRPGRVAPAMVARGDAGSA
ncbi:MAG TPA: molybdopterin cofactor-binding domain-containing protein [Thermoanaerobaculia bacterium]|nr:molybdopterin cofactor-binding domain-containing protein [Thermoanaerobaculia bacterium]